MGISSTETMENIFKTVTLWYCVSDMPFINGETLKFHGLSLKILNKLMVFLAKQLYQQGLAAKNLLIP